MKIIRKGFTFGFIILKTRRMYVIQFSLKDPWLIPNFGKVGDIFLFGWIFLYFGYVDLI